MKEQVNRPFEHYFLQRLLLPSVPAIDHSFCCCSMRFERYLYAIRGASYKISRDCLLLSDFPVAACVVVVDLLELELSSGPSASMVSNLDSTPATACCKNAPHLEDGFVGAAIAVCSLLLSRERVASIEVASDHTSNS